MGQKTVEKNFPTFPSFLLSLVVFDLDLPFWKGQDEGQGGYLPTTWKKQMQDALKTRNKVLKKRV